MSKYLSVGSIEEQKKNGPLPSPAVLLNASVCDRKP